MAEWKTSNSILTREGVLIFNKIKFGVGKLTISRIVVSNGTVEPSSLFTLTDVVGDVKKKAILSGIIPSEEGSEVSFYVTNEGLTTPLNVRQIGVFVTHPDYEEEQLYFITQSEDEGYDVLPAFRESITSFGYSIYFEHSRDATIEASVRPGNSIPKVDGAGVGNIPVFTSYGDVVDSGVNLENFIQSQSNFFKKNEGIVLQEGIHYGDEFPEGDSPVGRLFFKRVTE